VLSLTRPRLFTVSSSSKSVAAAGIEVEIGTLTHTSHVSCFLSRSHAPSSPAQVWFDFFWVLILFVILIFLPLLILFVFVCWWVMNELILNFDSVCWMSWYNVRVLILFVSFYLEPWLCYLCWFWQFELILELLFDNLSLIWVDFGRVVLIGLFLLNITFVSAFC
jgi:hypothetical protein